MSNSQFAMAIHVLALMAKSCDDRVKSEYIANSVNTNPVVIRRLLRNLFDANLVVSQTGACGGSCLTRNANEISLYDIYKAVSDREVFALHRQKPDQDCPVGRGIETVLCNLQKEFDSAIEERLSKMTLQDVIEKI
ncbi:MAG: Rrf2 family transcriptional regulator [Pyrinomonadaceae bacterium]|jgi:Rrf2 family protein|nr:Rrf2 family transcriptional regulator [Pyrinomonadaceae bacterium]